MKLNTRMNCILLTLLANSFLFGGVNANHQHHHHRHTHHHVHQQPTNWDIHTLVTAYTNFLSVPHDPAIAAYGAALLRVLEASDTLKHTTIFQDIQSMSKIDKLDNLGLVFGYPFKTIDDFQNLLDRLENCCAHMLIKGLANPMPQIHIQDNITSLFRVNQYNQDARMVSDYIERIHCLNLLPGSSDVYDALGKLNKAIGIILARPHTFPANFECPNGFYELLHMNQIECAYAGKRLIKNYAIGLDALALTGQLTWMKFSNRNTRWFR